MQERNYEYELTSYQNKVASVEVQVGEERRQALRFPRTTPSLSPYSKH
jgi:hypothetical protein